MNNIVGFYRRPSVMEGPRATYADVVEGARLFVVGAAFNGKPSTVSEVEIRGPVFQLGFALMVAHVGIREDGKPRKIETNMSLRDSGIIPNTYNMCRTFTNREDAEIYRARFDNHELTHFEQRHHEQIVRKRLKQFSL